MKIVWIENGETTIRETVTTVREPKVKYNKTKRQSFTEIMNRAGSDAAKAVHYASRYNR